MADRTHPPLESCVDRITRLFELKTKHIADRATEYIDIRKARQFV